MDAIVYTSNTGYTAEYALLLGKAVGLKAYELKEAKKRLAKGAEVICLGWVMGGLVRGYQGASKRYRVQAVCAVCMGEGGSQMGNIRRMNRIPDELPLFTLQGGFDMAKLRGVYKLMMKAVLPSLEKQLEEKKNRTPGEEKSLQMLRHGGSCVGQDGLAPVLAWIKGE